jgi:hypothetical protein
MTKSVDEMDLEELRSALRWETAERKRVSNLLAAYRSTVLGAVDTIRSAS